MSTRVAIVGISYRGNQRLTELPNAPTDALRVLEVMRRYARDKSDFFVAVEPEHTTEFGLRQGLLRFFSDGKPGDDVVFVFEGHGVEIAGKSYLQAADCPVQGTIGVLAVEEVTTWMDKGQPANRILILDACHTGQGRSKRIGLDRDVFFPDRGVSVLSACDLDEETGDSDEVGGGLFSFMICRALSGAAGTVINSYRQVTVTNLFQFVAREVPAWLNGNRQRLRIPASWHMTPRFVTDLRGDPVLTSVPLIQRKAEGRSSLSLAPTTSAINKDLHANLDLLQDLARTAAARIRIKWGSHRIFLDADLHRHELELLLGRCLADLGDVLSPVEVFVLLAAVCTHDLGLIETHAPQWRFRRAAAFVRSGKAHDLPILLPDDNLVEAVARTVEGMDGDCRHDGILWRGIPVHTDLLGKMMCLVHRLSVTGERLAMDVGDDDSGRAWVRRSLLNGVSDWEAGGCAVIQKSPKLNEIETTAITRWRAMADSALTLCQSIESAFGPLWIDIRD